MDVTNTNGTLEATKGGDGTSPARCLRSLLLVALLIGIGTAAGIGGL